MTNEKKKFLAPQIKVVEIEQADIICQSGGTEGLGNGNPIFGY